MHSNSEAQFQGKCILYTGKYGSLYISPNIIWVTKSRSMIWLRHVASMREINTYRILVGKPEKTDLEGLM
jgi:hypothetical protein